MRFNCEAQIPVRPPYRLDLTVEALRRVPNNAVDVVGTDGRYRRVLACEDRHNALEVQQPAPNRLHVRIGGKEAERALPVVERMLGTGLDLEQWMRAAGAVPWLRKLAVQLQGLRPPRYPTLWEALVHAIVFQQISLHAAAAILRRVVEALAAPIEVSGVPVFPFFSPQRLIGADDATLRAAGLSGNKIVHLRTAAIAVLEGAVRADRLEKMPSAAAASALQSIRGIGPWSANVVLLRGFGRLDVFPLKDSGVARNLRALAGDDDIDAGALLESLGSVRGMLYFHLLLGGMRNRPARRADLEIV